MQKKETAKYDRRRGPERRSAEQAFLILPVLSGILWGSASIFIRGLTDAGMDNVTILGARMSVSAVILFLGLLIYDKRMLVIHIRDLWIFVLLAILGMLGLNYCYNVSVNSLTVSLAAVLMGLSPVYVMIMARFLFGERITVKKVFCTALAVFGCVLVSGLVSGGGEYSPVSLFFGLMSGFLYGLYGILSKVAMGKGYHAFTITFYSVFISGIAMIPFADWGMIAGYATAAPAVHGGFLLLQSLCTSVLPYVLYTLSQIYVETGKVAILASGAEPSAAMVFGALIFAEIPSIFNIAGLIITIAALSVLCAPEKKKLH